MRPKRRIEIFLEKADLVNVINIMFPGLEEMYKEKYVKDIKKNLSLVKEFWNEHYDLRFSQVLVNMGIVPNYPGYWYYMEEGEILEKLNIDPKEYILWGNNYDKDMNRLEETKYLLVGEMNTGHIEAILDSGLTRNPKYVKAFKDELKLRKDEKKYNL
jgi:hypothetical protein